MEITNDGVCYRLAVTFGAQGARALVVAEDQTVLRLEVPYLELDAESDPKVAMVELVRDAIQLTKQAEAERVCLLRRNGRWVWVEVGGDDDGEDP